MGGSRLVPITREVLRAFYQQHPLEPVPEGEVEAHIEALKRVQQLVGKPGTKVAESVSLETPPRCGLGGQWALALGAQAVARECAAARGGSGHRGRDGQPARALWQRSAAAQAPGSVRACVSFRAGAFGRRTGRSTAAHANGGPFSRLLLLSSSSARRRRIDDNFWRTRMHCEEAAFYLALVCKHAKAMPADCRARLEQCQARLLDGDKTVQAVQASNTDAAAAQVKGFLPQVGWRGGGGCKASCRGSTEQQAHWRSRHRSVAIS